MKALPFMMLLALALPACDKTSAERSRDKSEDDEERAPAKQTAAPPALATQSAAAKPSASADEEDTPEIADASGAPPAPNADDAAFKDVQIPAGVTIPTEEDYEEKAEKEITAANFESELAKIEKELTP